jgi:hypothetical protein
MPGSNSEARKHEHPVKTDLELANERIHVLDATVRAVRGAMIVLRDELDPDSTGWVLATTAINTAADAVVWRPEEG